MRLLSLAVVGADHPNKRGPARRFEIALCTPGEPIDLRPEPTNKADPQAVAVYSARGVQIGYVRAERAPLIRTMMGRGEVRAIFQEASRWGAVVRVAFGGEGPRLPVQAEPPPLTSVESQFWPDDLPPDD